MPLTDHCDIFAAFHEDGFNRILGHVQRQRPSLFNYATAAVADDDHLLCQVIRAHPIVGLRANPLVTIEDPLPIPGTNFGINFAAQLVDVRIDFYPGNQFALPPELSPPLAAQRMALALRACAGLGCPPKDIADKFVPPPPPPEQPRTHVDERPKPKDLVVLPTRKLTCFCLDVYAVGGVRIRQYYGRPYLEPFVEALEIVDIKPVGLENSLECYLLLLLKLAVLPGVRVLLERAPLEIMNGVNVKIVPTPAPGQVPNNPSIEADELRAFIDLEVI